MKLHISLAKVPLSLTRKYLEGFNRTRYAQVFNKFGASGKGLAGQREDKFRIYIPYNSGAKMVPDTVVPNTQVVKYLESLGMKIDSYKAGTCFLPDGKRVVRIGKVLKDPAIKKVYDNDPARSMVKAVPAWVVISRHPYDIIGMSFDRGWKSCMHLTEGSNMRYLKRDVKYGSLVAYLIKEKDENINAPLARIALRPFTGVGGRRILMPGPIYTMPNPTFQKIVNKFCEYMNSGSPEGRYERMESLYNEGPGTVYHYQGTLDLKTLSDSNRYLVASNPSTPPEMLDTLSKTTDTSVILRLARNTNASPALLSKFSRLPSPTTRCYVAENISTPPEVLTKLARDKNREVRWAVAENVSTPPEVLTKLAKSTDQNARATVMQNPAAPMSLLLELASTVKDDDALHDMIEARQGKFPVKLQMAIAQNPTSACREVLLQVVNKEFQIDLEVWKLLAQDKSLEIRSSVASHEFLPVELIDIFTNDPDAEIRTGAAEQPGISVEALVRLSTDKAYHVRAAVASNPKTPSETLAKMLAAFKYAKDRYGYSNRDELISLFRNKNTPIEAIRAFPRPSDGWIAQEYTKALRRKPKQ